MLRGSQGKTGERADRAHTQRVPYKTVCGRCGARRVDEQIGIEERPLTYVAKLVRVFREVRRVLKPQGTCWLNLGDCHASGEIGFKPKDLMMLPHRVAIALQGDGWYVRQDNVWVKRNNMPESVKDRSTRAHEYVFHLSKSEKYYYDSAAISEPCAPDSQKRYKRGRSTDHKYADGGPQGQTIARSLEHMAKQDGHGRRHVGFNEREFAGMPRDRRNKRSWWPISTTPSKEKHYALMPLALAEICVLAGCPKGGFVLDPFSGLGTTGLVCMRHGRDYEGIELGSKYADVQRRRLRRAVMMLPQGMPVAAIEGQMRFDLAEAG